MTSKVNIGVRHILPVYTGFSLVAAIGVAYLIERAQSRKWLGIVAAVLVSAAPIGDSH